MWALQGDRWELMQVVYASEVAWEYSSRNGIDEGIPGKVCCGEIWR